MHFRRDQCLKKHVSTKTTVAAGPMDSEGNPQMYEAAAFPPQNLSPPGQGHRQGNCALTPAHAPPRGLELKRSSPTAKTSLQTTKKKSSFFIWLPKQTPALCFSFEET